MMMLRWQIKGSIVLVVVLTVLISVGVGYYATQSRLDVFVDRIGEDEGVQLARNLSREYTAARGWTTVDAALSEAGYIYDGAGEGERSEESEGEHSETLQHDQVRVVVVSLDGRVIADNLSDLSPGTVVSELEGHQETVFDQAANQPVGHVYLDVNAEYLSTESHGFLRTILYTTVIGGALTASLAILLALWLSKRITAPVTALTDATQAIAQGDAARLPVTSSDELGRMSAAFNRMTAALETQRELRRRLINDVSHELNTPLSVIKLEAMGMRDELQSPESASKHIIQEVNRLSGIVTDLDWLAETDHGELRLTREATSISKLLSAEMDRWKPKALAEQIELSLDLAPDMPNVDLDRMRLSQALGNLLNNAINSTDAGGGILLEARQEGEEALSISITDDGMGIDASDLPHVLDRFYRTDQSRTRGIGGTGLGLAIARAIVEAHGGKIAVSSDGPGQGATVTIQIPLNR